MLVQYVVGLCCLRRNPDAVDITVGDLVLDEAAEKRRDVDITVTLHEEDGTVRAFKAYEVKREGKPLDVATVEQLCIKLGDMPAVTHRAIVSASGFTSGAIAKANAHGVELFELKPWTRPLSEQFAEFQNAGTPSEFFRSFVTKLLVWNDWVTYLHVPLGPESFQYDDTGPLYAEDGSVHKTYASYGVLLDALLRRSTELLFASRLAHGQIVVSPNDLAKDLTAGGKWPHSHTLQVSEDQVYLKFATGLAKAMSFTISGHLEWESSNRELGFHILEQVPFGGPFAATALAEWGTPDGKMTAMIFDPESRTADVRTFTLSEKHKNFIRNLKILGVN
jgi:hypothetical protein